MIGGVSADGRGTGTPVAAIVLAGLLFCWPAAWNGFPLIFADSGTYLGQALQRYLGWDRPVFYSFFLLFLHGGGISLWPVVLGQSLIAAQVLAIALRVLDRPGPGPLLTAAVPLALLSGLPWFSSQIMPDLFTPITVLCLWLLGFARDRLGRWEVWYLLVLAVGSIAVHQAHLPLGLGLAACGAVLIWIREGAAAARQGLMRMMAPPLLAALALVAVNLVGHGRLALSPYGSVFVAARLIYDGPALEHLRRACPAAGYRICADITGPLPVHSNAFLWEPHSPLWTTLGGAKAWAPEASAIVAATLREHPLAVARAALSNTALQFTMIDTGDGLEPWIGRPGPDPVLREFFPHEVERLATSRQQAGLLRLDAEDFAPWHRVVAWVGLLALAPVSWLRWRHTPASALCVLVLAAALGNAALTGALSGPHHRYQARLAWLFAFAPVAAYTARRTTLVPTVVMQGLPTPRQDAATSG